MSTDLNHKREELIKKLYAEIDQKLKPKDAALVKEFAAQYYLSISPEDLLSRSIIDIYGALLSHWQFFVNRKPDESKIRIFNPQQEENGWQSTHTVIEMVQADLPFLIDSIKMALIHLDINIHIMIYMGGMLVIRDKNGKVTSIVPIIHPDSKQETITEAPIHIEIDKITDPKMLATIKSKLFAVIDDVHLAVSDWKGMRNRLSEVIEETKNTENLVDKAELSESIAFLNWILNDNFTLLGYCKYKFGQKNHKFSFESIKDSELGLFRKFDYKSVCHFCDLPDQAQKIYFSKQQLMIGKINMVSTIHRPAYIDFISVKKYNNKGEVIGEDCFIGLYTAIAYNISISEIPFVRKKIENVVKKLGFPSSSHDCKALLNILENLPRDDIFHATDVQLHDIALGILHLQERQVIKFFIRRDVFGRFFSCLVFVPKEIFNSALRQRYSNILLESLEGSSISFATKFSESILARIHFIVRIEPSKEIAYDVKEIEEKLIEISKTWNNSLHSTLTEYMGEEKGNGLLKSYANSFPAGYKEAFTARTAVMDIQHIEKLTKSDASNLEMSMYHAVEDADDVLRFKLYHMQKPMPLSDVVPILEHLGLRIISERPYEISRLDGEIIWINDYRMLYCREEHLASSDVKQNFQEAFAAIWNRDCDNDGFNRLVLSAKLNWREVAILRSYYKYLWQIGIGISQNFVEDALYSNSKIAFKLVKLFDLRFNPNTKQNLEKQQNLKTEIEADLEKVSSLTEDIIIRKYIGVIFATLRTNYYQKSETKALKNYIAFKLDSNLVPDIPKPKPLFEIFVYSPRVEGVHLRGAKVARGGLRWSDRPEDYRTEVLGLMKAQQVKNAVIVPLGAKGGFVVKQITELTDRGARMQEVISCYKTFISGLLDITDNRVNSDVVTPENVVKYDEVDPYLVVAADKGTATFSDIANEISNSYNFWLGDAFASGGSAGYDHKKMGITAKGAWESVKLHFQHLGVDTQSEPFSVIGIGDMAGDVFGNGMLLSRHIKLVAAINHIHIFLDPSPDCEKSYLERKRLFNLPRSSWLDYNKELISKGGGVFSRSAKYIKLTPEIKILLNLEKDTIVPNDLIIAILKAKADLLWNGGIGTFIKASTESHLDAGDRTNDAIRIDAPDLNVKVVAEGGNLGITQLARVEYSQLGGVINTDAIDNSAGVNCSDNEVNIKVLLNDVVNSSDMTSKQRNNLLSSMSEEVAEIVLNNNKKQNRAITIAEAQATSNLKMHDRIMDELEKLAGLDRKIEFLPDKEEITKRKSKNAGLTRPELAVLLAYVKIQLKKELLASDLPESPYVNKTLDQAFPTPLREKYKQYMQNHRLKREIIVTQISNLVVDEMGISFFHRLREETGSDSPNIVKCYLTAREIFEYEETYKKITELNSKVDYNMRLSIVFELNRLMRRATRWFLRNRRTGLNIVETIKLFNGSVQKVRSELPELLHGGALENMQSILGVLIKENVSKEIATEIAKFPAMFSALDIVEAANLCKEDVIKFATVYYLVGARLYLGWFREKIKDQAIRDHWDALARAAFRDDVDRHQRNIAVIVLNTRAAKGQDPDELVAKWFETHKVLLERWEHFVQELHTGKLEFTMFAVAIRELVDITQAVESFG